MQTDNVSHENSALHKATQDVGRTEALVLEGKDNYEARVQSVCISSEYLSVSFDVFFYGHVPRRPLRHWTFALFQTTKQEHIAMNTLHSASVFRVPCAIDFRPFNQRSVSIYNDLIDL
uniref:Uncharacterized protein n=1 Tax=Glossina austeni TaxID=7395 RepID=A0A1A9UGW2_GLOAU